MAFKDIGLGFDRSINDIQDNFDEAEKMIRSANARVSNLIQATPQPGEIVDVRVGLDGTRYKTAKDRIDTEQLKNISQLARTINKNDIGVLDLDIFDEPSRSILQGMEVGTINAVLGSKNVKNENIDDGAVTPRNLNIEQTNIVQDMVFVSGGLAAGEDRQNPLRVRSDNFVRVSRGDVVKIIDNRFGLCPFMYADSNVESYTGTPGVWLKEYTFTDEAYVRLNMRLDTDSPSVRDFVDEMLSIVSLTGKRPFITKSSMMSDKIVSREHLTDDLVEELLTTTQGSDLVMFMGQSNIAGRGTASQAPTVMTGAGVEFRAISDPTRLYPISEPFGRNENKPGGISENNKTGSLVSSYVNEFYSITGKSIVGVSASRGGSSINEWQPGTPYLNDAIERLNSARAWLNSNNYKFKRVYMVWCQGETDANLSQQEYTAKLKIMIEEMRKHGIEHCYIIRIGNKNASNDYKRMIEIQTNFCKAYANATLVSTLFSAMTSDKLNLMQPDGIHYTQEGYNRVGKESAKNVAFHVKNNKEPYMFDPEFNNLYFSHKN